MNEINIKKLRFDYGLSQEELGLKLGLTKQQIGRTESGKSRLTDENREKLLDLFPNLQSNINSQDDCILFPVRSEVHVSMGYGVTVYDETQTGAYAISRKLASDLGVKPDNADIIFGTGNSMEPTILGGDALLVDRNRKNINDGKIYCIRHDGQLKAKRLQQISKKRIKVISDNKDYEPITIDFEKELDVDFEVIGEIRWCGRIFL